MSSITKLMTIHPKRLVVNSLSICKQAHTTTEAEKIEEPIETEPQKPQSKRMEEFRKKLEEDAPIDDDDVDLDELQVVQVKKDDPFAPWPDNTNPHTGEIGGPSGPEPTRYGDWERKGICSDF